MSNTDREPLNEYGPRERAEYEWYGQEAERISELMNDVLESARDNPAIELVQHGGSVDSDGTHEASVSVRIEGQSFEDYWQEYDHDE